MASVVCPSCGIKVKASRDRCPRCRQPLERPEAPEPQQRPDALTRSGQRSTAFLTAVAAAVVLIAGLAGFALWRNGESTAAFPVATAPITVTPKSARAPAEVSANPPSVVVDSEQFMEPAQGGRVAYAQGDFEKAAALYEDAVADRPRDAESWSNFGQVLVRMNRVEESIEKFQRAIELNPDKWSYHFNLARAQGLLGKWDGAVEEYRVAQRLYPDDYATAFNLGLALRKAGNDAAAVEAFKRAIELDPQDPTFHFSLAGAYERLGQAADAIAEYQRTLELAGGAPETPAIQARISRLKGESPRPATAPVVAPVKEPAQPSPYDR